MKARNDSLRSTLTWIGFLLAGSALVAVGTIVFLTSALHRTTTLIESSANSIRAATEAQIDLVVHAQAQSPVVKRDLAGSVQRKLLAAKAYVGRPEEKATLSRAERRVHEYFTASRDSTRPAQEITARHTAAYSALEDLTNLNVAAAQTAARRAARLDHFANIAGIGLGMVILVIAAFIIYWVQGLLMRPILDLATIMERFSRGERSLRMSLAGPRELREMAERFNEMAAQIEHQREQQRAFLAGIAHDLRNPVNALLLSAEVARAADTSLPPDHVVHRILDRNVRQLRKMDRMIGDFLDVARVEAGNLELRLELRDLREPVRATVELFEGTSARHELVLTLPADPVYASIDALRIEQVVANLLSNAIKYSPDGGGVEISLAERGGRAVIVVTDHGLGMSPELQGRMFEPFHRGLSHDEVPGAGLGMFVARRIVEAHGGRIEAESSLGVGSTFRVILPTGLEHTSAD